MKLNFMLYKSWKHVWASVEEKIKRKPTYTHEVERERRKCLLERKDPHLEIDETEFYEMVFCSA